MSKNTSIPRTELGGEGSQARISCDPVVAINALDTLKVSMWVDWSGSHFLERLESVKLAAQQGEDDSAPVDLMGEQWNVMRSGTVKFPFRLMRGDVRLLISRRKATGGIPNMKLEIGSMSCWEPGYSVVFAEIQRIIELFGGAVLKERVSEVHLCSDFVGQKMSDLPVTNQDHWVTRATKFQVNYERRRLTGVTVGRGDFMLRIYDKVEELRHHGHKQEFFARQWEIPYGSAPVTRVEFQIRRNVLREFRPLINTVADLESCYAGLWAYAIEKWARLTAEPVDRSNKHQGRSTLHTFWETAKAVLWAGRDKIERIREVVQIDVEALQKQATGICMTIAAALERKPDDIETIIAFAQGKIESEMRRLFRNRADFTRRMNRKIASCVGINTACETV